VDAVPEGSNWVHEIKFDGYRLLGFQAGQTGRLITRNGKDWTGSFPSLSAALSELNADNAVLDMEAVVLDGRGKSSFQALQNALGEGGDRESIVAFVFDLLYLNGKDLTKLKLLERKEKIEALLGRSETLRYSGHVIGQGEEMLVKACEAGLEGIISKEANAPYVMGRGKSWLKIKCSLRQEFIIVGYSDPRKGARALGALYLGYRNNGGLQYAGKVGTGFTMKSARELTDRLTRISVTSPVLSRAETLGLGAGEWRAVHWVKPILLCEVSFTEWTADGRIRHPSFQGLREDKNASQVSKENLWQKWAKRHQWKAREQNTLSCVESQSPIRTGSSPTSVISPRANLPNTMQRSRHGCCRGSCGIRSVFCVAPPGSISSVSSRGTRGKVWARMYAPLNSKTREKPSNICTLRTKEDCWK
jgi:bifunctional non-homologous end joining protein LigD